MTYASEIIKQQQAKSTAGGFVEHRMDVYWDLERL